jgi:hypothetical protein
MALVLPEESKKLHIGSVKAAAYSSTDTIQSKVTHQFHSLYFICTPKVTEAKIALISGKPLQ